MPAKTTAKRTNAKTLHIPDGSEKRFMCVFGLTLLFDRTMCKTDFSECGTYLIFMEADLRFSVKNYSCGEGRSYSYRNA